MAIVFPISPSVNDTFTSGSITYKWDGDKWIGLGVTPADRLVEGSNSLEIDANNNLVWSGGNVGIGTDNPVYFTEIYNTSTNTYADNAGVNVGPLLLSTVNNSATAGQTATIRFVSSDNGGNQNAVSVIANIQETSSGNNAALAFQVRGADGVKERLRINSSGNVGINIATNFNSKLTLVDNNDAQSLGLFRNFTGVGAAGTYIDIGCLTSGGVPYVGARILGYTNSDRTGGGLSIYTKTGDSSYERLSVLESGDVGINQSVPEGKLHIHGSTRYVQTISTETGVTAGTTSGTIYRQQYTTTAGTSRRMAFFGIERKGGSGDQTAKFTMELCPDNSTNLGLSSPAANTTAFQFDNNGRMWVKSGGGIDFSANGNAAGMTSELLDDYEVGTWTPDIDNAYITTPGTTYNSRAGKYVKIGKMVLARFTMNIAGVINSGVGPLFFGGLPFVHDTSDISHRGLQASLYISGPNTPTGAVNVNLGYAVLDNGNYYLTFSTPIDDQASNNGRVIQAADLSNGDVISGTIMYIST